MVPQQKHLKILRNAFVGFLLAAFGVSLGFSGSHFDVRWLFVAGFVIVALGLTICFISILYGWIHLFFFAWRDVPPAPPKHPIREDVVPTHAFYPHSKAPASPMIHRMTKDDIQMG